jgi:hypothetical protein
VVKDLLFNRKKKAVRVKARLLDPLMRYY